MLPDAALTAVAYAMDWHRTRQHPQQEAAAEQTDLLDAAAHGDGAGAGGGHAGASGALEDDGGPVELARAAAGTVNGIRSSATPGAANCPFTTPCRIWAAAWPQLPEPVVDFDHPGARWTARMSWRGEVAPGRHQLRIDVFGGGALVVEAASQAARGTRPSTRDDLRYHRLTAPWLLGRRRRPIRQSIPRTAPAAAARGPVVAGDDSAT
jgi:hypothetical protein